MKKKILVLAFLLYAIVGFFIFPAVIKSMMLKSISEQTDANAYIKSVYFNPFTFKFRVNDMSLFDKKGHKLFAFNLFEINLEPHSFLELSIHFKDIKLNKPKVFLVYDKDKQINFNKILKVKETSKTKQKDAFTLPRIIVDKIDIDGGSLYYEDFSKKDKFEISLTNLDFVLKDLDTKELQKSDAKVKLTFELEDDGLIKLQTKLVSLSPLSLEGLFEVNSAKLYTQYKYIKDNLNIEIADGELSLSGDFFVNIDDLNTTKISNLDAKVSDIRIKPKDVFQDILTLKSFSIEDATLYPFKDELSIQNVRLSKFNIDTNMDKKGNLDIYNYLKTNFKTETKKEIKTDKKTKEWKVSINNISLDDISGSFQDKSVYPKVISRVDDLDIGIKNFTLLGDKPFSYDINLLANNTTKCNLKGQVLLNSLDINSNIKCSDFDVVYYKPYLKRFTKQQYKKFNLDLKKANIGFGLNLELKDENTILVTYIDDANISINNFKLNKRSTRERLVSFASFDIKGINLNTKDKDISISQTKLGYLYINPKRYSNGSLNVENLIVFKKVKNKVLNKAKKVNKQDYRVRIDKFLLQNAQINFKDAMLKPALRTRLHNINIKLSNIDTQKLNWMDYRLNARLNYSGYIKSSGKLKHSPLKERGYLELKHIRLKDFSPYVEDRAFIKIADGILDIKTKLNYEKSALRADMKANGSLKLRYLFLNDSRDDSSIFAINHLDIKSFTYNLSPDILFIDKIDLNSFYINAVVNKDKSMNFSHLVKNNSIKEKDEVKTKKENKFPIWVLQTDIKNGNAGFADHSLPVDFNTQIHNVNGMLYALSSLGMDTSYLDIDGEVNAYGSTKLLGSVNISDIKNYTDLSFNFRNLDLSAISGYSAVFAGYKIDSGKLFLDLKYDIKDSQLNSSNNILIKNIKLGSEYKDDNVTPLPLKLAVALLEDSDGVIDISMPIVGNVENPDFKYGSLVMKTFFKLIGSAITSPFRFLGSALGIDGDKLSYIEFEPAKSNLIPSEREKLDNLAKIMIKKPKIFISLSGIYNAKVDRYQLKKYKLIQKLLKRGDITNRQNHINMMSIDMLEDIYVEVTHKDDLKTIQAQMEKRYKDDVEYDKNYREFIVDKCIESQELSKDDLQYLAKNRVDTIKNYLVVDKMIDASRIKEKELKVSDDSSEKFIHLKLKIEVN